MLDFASTSQITASNGQPLRPRPQPTQVNTQVNTTQATAASRGAAKRTTAKRAAATSRVIVHDDSDDNVEEKEEEEDDIVEVTRGRRRGRNSTDEYMPDAIDNDDDAPVGRWSTAPHRGRTPTAVRRGTSPLALTTTNTPRGIVLDHDDDEDVSVIAPTPSGNARGSQVGSARKRTLPGIFGVRGSQQGGGRKRA